MNLSAQPRGCVLLQPIPKSIQPRRDLDLGAGEIGFRELTGVRSALREQVIL